MTRSNRTPPSAHGVRPIAKAARPVDRVVDRLRADLLAGAFTDHLPAERQLAEALGVSRLTLRAGLARLEVEGLVRARQGEGVLVLDPQQHGTLALLAHMDLAQQPEVVRSFLELRRSVAADAIALACERATTAEIDALVALARHQENESDAARYRQRDLEFARAVLTASRSFASLLVFNALVPVYQAHPFLAELLVADRERSLAGYAVTVALLRARDAASARSVVREALEQLDHGVMQTLQREQPPKRRRPTARRKPR